MRRFIVGIKPQAKCLLLSMCVGPNVKAVHAGQTQWSRWKILLTALCSSLCGMAYYMVVMKGSVSGQRLDSLSGSFIQPSLHHCAHDHVTWWPPKWWCWSPHSFSPAPTHWRSETAPQGCCSSPLTRALKGLLWARSWVGDRWWTGETRLFPPEVSLSLTSGGGGSLVAQSCPTLATSWTVAHQAPLSMGFSRQEYCSGLLFPSLGEKDLRIFLYLGGCATNQLNLGFHQLEGPSELPSFLLFLGRIQAQSSSLTTDPRVLFWLLVNYVSYPQAL